MGSYYYPCADKNKVVRSNEDNKSVTPNLRTGCARLATGALANSRRYTLLVTELVRDSLFDLCDILLSFLNQDGERPRTDLCSHVVSQSLSGRGPLPPFVLDRL